MSRRNAALAGLVAWLAAMVWAATWTDARGLAVWAVLAAVIVAASIAAGRALSGMLRDAVLKDRP